QFQQLQTAQRRRHLLHVGDPAQRPLSLQPQWKDPLVRHRRPVHLSHESRELYLCLRIYRQHLATEQDLEHKKTVAISVLHRRYQRRPGTPPRKTGEPADRAICAITPWWHRHRETVDHEHRYKYRDHETALAKKITAKKHA